MSKVDKLIREKKIISIGEITKMTDLQHHLCFRLGKASD